jgi:hypothetical protein
MGWKLDREQDSGGGLPVAGPLESGFRLQRWVCLEVSYPVCLAGEGPQVCFKPCTCRFQFQGCLLRVYQLASHPHFTHMKTRMRKRKKRAAGPQLTTFLRPLLDSAIVFACYWRPRVGIHTASATPIGFALAGSCWIEIT